LIVAYEGRLTRFGFETLKKISFRNRNRGNKQRGESPQKGLVEDLVTIVPHSAEKLYEMRPHKYKEVVEGVKKLISG
jgi:putative resolvase